MNQDSDKPKTESSKPQSNQPPADRPPDQTQPRKPGRDRLIKRLFILALLVAAALVYFLQLEGPSFPGWDETDLSAALETAKQKDRPVLVYFISSRPSQIARRMAKTTLAKRDNREAIDSAELIRVLVETSTDSDLATKYSLSKLPTMMVLSPEGVQCPTMKDYAGEFIGEVPFRNEFLEPRLDGWLDSRRHNLENALRQAKREDRPLLALFMGVPSSGEARRLAFTTLAAKSAREAIQKARYLLIAARVTDEQHPLARKYGIKKLPTLVIITPAGQQRRREGYVKTEDFLKFLAPGASAPAD